MAFELYTPCGRYSKRQNENFLRRTTNGEPMERNQNRTRTPYFELADESLAEILRLLKCTTDEEVDQGKDMLQARLAAAEQASLNLSGSAFQTASRRQREVWLDESRRGPQFLVSILGRLKGEVTDAFAAIKELDALFIKGSTPSQSARGALLPINVASLRAPSVHAPTPGRVQDVQGQEFGLGHDPGDVRGHSVMTGNMFAPSIVASSPSQQAPQPPPVAQSHQ
ncbi:hypothetical protein BJ875DRAFT_539875 [Amylocarpus encephaloides]|uniref:Uncharacterized protein n=1 Tax=Amylocarpus encephaloides TaxID=45428 RepID=A0A9P8CAF5_9HELO|nr:hypothetical protein BJ875DRAFT_539875 [Amylocarpus encephaloides]